MKAIMTTAVGVCLGILMAAVVSGIVAFGLAVVLAFVPDPANAARPASPFYHFPANDPRQK